MSILELKQRVQQLSAREREDLEAFLVRLRHETPASRRKMATTIRTMKAGRAHSAEKLVRLMARE